MPKNQPATKRDEGGQEAKTKDSKKSNPSDKKSKGSTDAKKGKKK